MNIVLLFFALQILCLAGGFGLAYLILKNTSCRHLSVVVAPVIFPACLILMITLCGHSVPTSLPPAVPLLITALLLVCSAFVVLRARRDLAIVRWDLLRAGGIVAAATLLGMTSLTPDIAHGSLTYLDFQINNELLNYAALAGHLMGRTVHQAYAAEYSNFIMSRSGADLLLASLAQAVNAPPANCLYLLIALFRAQAIAAFGFLLLRATNSAIDKRPALLYSGLALFGLCALELLGYSVSFLSQYGVAPLVILAVAFLIREEDVLNLRILGALSLLYLCTELSYPEMVPLLAFVQMGQASFLALRRRSIRLFLFAASPFAAAFVLNPALALARYRFLTGLANVQAGYVMFVPARADIVAFGATILGLRFPYLGVTAFDNRWTEAVVVVVFAVYAAAAFYLVFKRRNQNWAACIAILFIACTTITWFSDVAKDGPAAVYKADKAIIYTHFLFVAALVIVVAERPQRRAWRYTLVAMYLALLIANVLVGAEVIGRFTSWRKVFPLAEVTRAVNALPNGVPVALPEGNGNSAMYWDGVLQYFGVADRYVDPQTRKRSPAVFDAHADPNLWPAASRGETGIVIADKFKTALDGGSITAVPANSRLDQSLYRAASFVLFRGRLSQAVNEFSALFHVKSHDLGSSKVPLLTTGERLNGSIVYLNPDSPGHYRLELDVWYLAHKNGAEMAAGASATDDDVILLEGERTEEAFTISATVNGRPALQYTGPFEGVSAPGMFWAKNPIFFPGVAAACEQCTIERVLLNHDIQK